MVCFLVAALNAVVVTVQRKTAKKVSTVPKSVHF